MSLFNLPEIDEIFVHFKDTLLDESERGAILIGTEKVDEQLSKLIERILPRKSRKYKEKLLKYPGVLSSFSAKIELAYAFRLISEELRISLNNLRKIRNEAAHSSNSFSIADYRKGFEEIFTVVLTPLQLQNMALSLMFNPDFGDIHSAQRFENMTEEEKREEVNRMIEDTGFIGDVEKQIPRWELMFGLSMICVIIKREEDKILELLGKSKTWSELNKKVNKKEDNND